MLTKAIKFIQSILCSKNSVSIDANAPVIRVSELAKFQVEAEHGIRAINAMLIFYAIRDSDFDQDEFIHSCILLMTALESTLQKLSSIDSTTQSTKQRDP